MKNPRITKKDKELIKGALRRVFSRSELRREALKRNETPYKDKRRPRVTKWGWCESCGIIEALYLLEVDHHDPVIPIKSSLEMISLEKLADNIWCSIDNLKVLCKACHRVKSGLERKERAKYKKSVSSKNKLFKSRR